jgi:predicted aspartyl protease
MKQFRGAFFLFFLLLPLLVAAQYSDLRIDPNTKRVDIPFEYRNGFIVVNVTLNNVLPLKFILDTGAEHTIITERKVTDLLNLAYERRLTIMGADLSTELYAYLARGVSLQVGQVAGLNRSILILEQDYIQFEAITGLQIHGILGSDFFRRFILKVDYQQRLVSLYDPQFFVRPEGFKKLDIEIYRNKPYLTAQVNFQKDTVRQLKFLIDTGASLPLLLETNTNPRLRLPEHVVPSQLGIGLGGHLEGYLGRVDALSFADLRFQQVITNFQDLSGVLDSTITANRNGIIGNDILSRFTLIIDYFREDLYLRPNKKYDDEFKFDRSGMQIIASGEYLNTFIVFNVLPDSPAFHAGIKPGDEILSVNFLSTNFMTLGSLTAKFQKKEGKKMRLKIRRRTEKIKFFFRLEDII